MQRDLNTVRRENLKALLQKFGGPSSLAKRLGFAGPSYITQLATGHRAISEKTARKFERELGLAEYALDKRPGEALPFAGTDRAVLAESVRVVGEEIERMRMKLDAQRFARLVAVVYEQAIRTGAVDRENAAKLLELMQ